MTTITKQFPLIMRNPFDGKSQAFNFLVYHYYQSCKDTIIGSKESEFDRANAYLNKMGLQITQTEFDEICDLFLSGPRAIQA